MRTKYLLFVGLLFSTLAACKQRGATVAMQHKAPANAADDMFKNGGAEEKAEAPASPPTGSHTNVIPTKIIRNADIRFSVSDFAKSKSLIAQAVADSKGYIASESESKSDYDWSNTVVLRVPSDKFDECLAALAGQAKQLDRKNITSEDMTEEYVDLAARMKARKEVELRYIQILQKANKVEDILAVEEQLKSIREEAEAAQGRLQYIDQQVAMSTITLYYYQPIPGAQRQAPGFFTNIGTAITEGWDSALVFIVAAISVWPIWLVLATLLFTGRRLYRKLRKQPAEAPAAS